MCKLSGTAHHKYHNLTKTCLYLAQTFIKSVMNDYKWIIMHCKCIIIHYKCGFIVIIEVIYRPIKKAFYTTTLISNPKWVSKATYCKCPGPLDQRKCANTQTQTASSRKGSQCCSDVISLTLMSRLHHIFPRLSLKCLSANPFTFPA